MSAFDITIAGFLNTNGSDAGAAAARRPCDGEYFYCRPFLRPCMCVCESISVADLEMEPRAGSPPLVIPTTPSLAIPAPLVDRQMFLPPPTGSSRPLTSNTKKKRSEATTLATRWWWWSANLVRSAHLVRPTVGFFDQIGRQINRDAAHAETDRQSKGAAA